MPTMTAAADSVKAQVRLDLDFSDIDAPYAYVLRVDSATGATTPVRGHGASQTINGLPYVPMQAGYKAVLFDTEAPLDTMMYYTATAPSVTLNANSTFSGGYVDPWFVTDPNVTMRITTNSAGTNFLSFYTNGAVASPTIRAEDVPATAGATLTFTVSAFISASNGVIIGFDCLSSTGVNLGTFSTTAGAPLTLTTLTASGATPANTVAVRPFAQMQGTPGSGTTFSLASASLSNAAGSATSGGARMSSLGSCWLKDPIRPGNNVKVDFSFDPNPGCTPTEGVFWQSLDTESQGANSAVFNINNQAVPTVVSKARSSISSTLTLVSRTFADRTRLDTLNAPGSPLLLQVPDEYGQPDRYMSVGTTAVQNVLPDRRFPIRVYQMPHNVVAAPGGFMQGTVGTRWQDLCNVYPTWTALAAVTWTGVLDGQAG